MLLLVCLTTFPFQLVNEQNKATKVFESEFKNVFFENVYVALAPEEGSPANFG